MKRILSMLLVLCMVVSMLPLAVFAAEATTVASVSGETVTTSGYTVDYTAETAGTLTVTAGDCSPGWRYKVCGPNYESIYMTKWAASQDHEITAGDWTVVFYAYSSALADNVEGTVSFDVTFTPAESGEGTVVKEEYEVSDSVLSVGDNTLNLLETAVTTIYVFEPTETGTYKFTAPADAILGYWGAGTWFLSNPNSTTNTYEWTCSDANQSACIGVSGVEGSFTLNVAKTAEYQEQVIHEVTYQNQATLTPFALPENAELGAYVDVYGATHSAVLGSDDYYHLDSADGAILLIDMDHICVLSDKLKSDVPVMYAYVDNEDGSQTKYDIGAAVQAYEAVCDANKYYPLTSDLIFFYDTYAAGQGVYSFYLNPGYNEDCVWMFACRTMTLAEEEEGDGEETPATNGTITVPTGEYIVWTAPTTGTVKFTVSPATTVVVLNNGEYQPVLEITEGTATLAVTANNSFEFFAPEADTVVTWEYVADDETDDDETSGTIAVESGSHADWTAPATGSVTFTVDPSNADAVILQSGSAVGEIANGAGSVTADVVANTVYTVANPGGSAISVSWKYNEASEGGDSEITYTDLVIGNNQINAADAHWSYTAESAGTLTLTTSSAIMGEVSYSYSINDGEAVAMDLSTTYELALAADDVVKIDVTAAGYSTLTAAWSGESSGEGDDPANTLVLGDNAVELAQNDQDGETWTYSATEAGTLTVTVSAMSQDTWFEGTYEDVPSDYLEMIFARNNVSLVVEETNANSNTYTVDVAANQTVTIQMYSSTGVPTKATLNLAMSTSSEGGEADPEGSETNPYIITSIPCTLEATLTDDNAYDGVWFKYVATEEVTIEESCGKDCFVSFYVNGEMYYSYYFPLTLNEGDVLLMNMYSSYGAGDYTANVGSDLHSFGVSWDEWYYDDWAGEWYVNVYYACENCGTEGDGWYSPTISSETDENGLMTLTAKVTVNGTEYTNTHEHQFVAKLGENFYDTVADAVAAAASGDTIYLLADATESQVVLMKGVTLDLNGHTLTVTDGAVAIKGNAIIDGTQSTGLLVVGKDALVLDESNAQLPVWNGTGYLFITVTFKQQIDEGATVSGGIFRFKPEMNNAAAQEVLKTALADSGLSVIVRVSWTTGSGNVSQNFVFDAATAQKVFTSGTLTLAVSGLDNIASVSAVAVIESAADAEVFGEVLTVK